MKKANHTTLLLHPFFIACLIALLLNDFVLKEAYHNWLTGKVSDVAGLAVFAMFFTTLAPQKKKLLYVVIPVIFIWWKSPLSQLLINFCNTVLQIPLNRVVDYTDVVALLILFVTWPLQPVSAITFYKKLVTYAMGATSVMAFCATSSIRHVTRTDNRLYIGNDYKTTLTEQEILHRLDSLQISYVKDSFAIPAAYYRCNYLYIQKDTAADTVKYIYMPNDDNATLYNRNTTPNYIGITNFVIDGDTLPKIKLRVREDYDKKNFIELEDIELSSKTIAVYLSKPTTIKDDYCNRIYVDIIRKLH